MKINLYLLLVLLFFCCQSEPDQKEKAPVVLPNTPEEVAQQWVEAYYKNDFSKAELLSTDLTKIMMDSVKKELDLNAPIIDFKIYDLSCETQNDSSLCSFIYEEEGEKYNEYYHLLNVNGQWLVNEPWDDSLSPEREMELLIKEELERIFEEEDN